MKSNLPHQHDFDGFSESIKVAWSS